MYARIHHDAYDDSFTPRYGSYFCTAWMRPMFPSWIEVEHVAVGAPVLLRDLDDQAQVGGDEARRERRLVLLAELDRDDVLLLARHQRVAPQLVQVGADGRVVGEAGLDAAAAAASAALSSATAPEPAASSSPSGIRPMGSPATSPIGRRRQASGLGRCF